MVRLLVRLGMTGTWCIAILFAFATSLPLGSHYGPHEGWFQNHDAVGFSPSTEIPSFHHPHDALFSHVDSHPNRWPHESFSELQALPGSSNHIPVHQPILPAVIPPPNQWPHEGFSELHTLPVSSNIVPSHQSMPHAIWHDGFESEQQFTRFEHGGNGAQGTWHQNWPQHTPEVQPNDVPHDASRIRHPAKIEQSGKTVAGEASHSLNPDPPSERPVKKQRTVQRIASALRQNSFKRPKASTLEGLRLGVPMSRLDPTILASGSSSSLYTGSPQLVSDNTVIQAEPTTTSSGARAHGQLIASSENDKRNDADTARELKVFQGSQGRILPTALYDLPETDPPIQKEKGERRTTYEGDALELEEIQKKINSEVFADQLKWIPPESFTESQLTKHRQAALTKSRVLPHVKVPSLYVRKNGGTVRNIRMTVRGGFNSMIKTQPGSELRGMTIYSFWGIPEGRQPLGPKFVYDFGAGYLKDNDAMVVVHDYLKAKAKPLAEVMEHTRV